MTDLEGEFLRRLITASWPLRLQIAFGIAFIGGYWIWTRIYYAAVDPWLRRWLSGVLGTNVVWVLRHDASYQTPLELGLSRQPWRRWTWGIEQERERTWSRDAAALLLSLLFVSLIGGLWSLALLFFVTLTLKALSYAVFFPSCIAALAIYAIFWTGRYSVAR